MQTIFITDQNTSHYKSLVQSWLRLDFITRNRPDKHFWYNVHRIGDSFDECNALVVVNEQEELVGYMTWIPLGAQVEIDILEVNEKYRRQGICKKMLAEFTDKYNETVVLTASVLPAAQAVFEKMNYSLVATSAQRKYYKVMKPIAREMSELPDGRVLAVCSSDFYQVRDNPELFRSQMKYFQLELNSNDTLKLPIVTSFAYDGYVAIYYNKELMVENKTRRLFNNRVDHCDSLLVVDRIELKPEAKKCFEGTDFFLPEKQVNDKELADLPPVKKRKRSNAFFSLPDSITIKGELIDFPSAKKKKLEVESESPATFKR